MGEYVDINYYGQDNFAQEVEEEIKKHKTIGTLVINNSLTPIDFDFSNIDLKNLTSIHLKGLVIHKDSFKELLQRNPELLQVTLDDCTIDDLSAFQACENPNTAINISSTLGDGEIKECSFKEIEELLKKNPFNTISGMKCHGLFDKIPKEIELYYNDRISHMLDNAILTIRENSEPLTVSFRDYLALEEEYHLSENYHGKVILTLDRGIKDAEKYFEAMKNTHFLPGTELMVTPEQCLAYANKVPNDLVTTIAFSKMEEYFSFEEQHGEVYSFPAKMVQQFDFSKEDAQRCIELGKFPDLSNASYHIRSMGELDVELAGTLKVNGLKSIHSYNQTLKRDDVVSTDRYIFARGLMDEMLSRVIEPDADDPNREKKIFGQIFRELVLYGSYDFEAADYFTDWREAVKIESDKEYRKQYVDTREERHRRASNIYDGLERRHFICGGMSEAVRQANSIKGQLVEVVNGINKANPHKAGHAWIQMYLDGEWLNGDPTCDWDRVQGDMPTKCMFLSDQEEEKIHGREFVYQLPHQCTRTFSQEEKNAFMYPNGISQTRRLNFFQDTMKKVVSGTKNNLMIDLYHLYSVGKSQVQNALKVLERTKEELGRDTSKSQIQTPESLDEK